MRVGDWIQTPDGWSNARTGEVEPIHGPSRALEEPAATEDDKSSPLGRSFRQAVGSGVRSLGTVASDIGLPSVGEPLREYGQGVIERNPTQIRELRDIAEHPITAVQEALGQAGASIAPTLAGAFTGARLGSMVGGVPGAAAGGLIGGFAPNLVGEYGETRDIQKQQGIDNKGMALAAAIPSSALEYAGDVLVGGRLMPKAVRPYLGKLGSSTLPEGSGIGARLAHGGKEALKGAAIEGPLTEGPQTILERLGGGAPVFNQEGLQDIGVSSALGAIGGGAIRGGIETVAPSRDPLAAPATPPATAPVTAPIATPPVVPPETPLAATPAGPITNAVKQAPQAPINAQIPAETQAVVEDQKGKENDGMANTLGAGGIGTTGTAPIGGMAEPSVDVTGGKLGPIQGDIGRQGLAGNGRQDIELISDQDGRFDVRGDKDVIKTVRKELKQSKQPQGMYLDDGGLRFDNSMRSTVESIINKTKHYENEKAPETATQRQPEIRPAENGPAEKATEAVASAVGRGNDDGRITDAENINVAQQANPEEAETAAEKGQPEGTAAPLPSADAVQPVVETGGKPAVRKFYTRTNDGALTERPDAKPLDMRDVPNAAGHEFFTHKEGGMWVVSHAETGGMVAEGKTKKLAIDAAKGNIGGLPSPESFSALIKRKAPKVIVDGKLVERIKEDKHEQSGEAVGKVQETVKSGPSEDELLAELNALDEKGRSSSSDNPMLSFGGNLPALSPADFARMEEIKRQLRPFEQASRKAAIEKVAARRKKRADENEKVDEIGRKVQKVVQPVGEKGGGEPGRAGGEDRTGEVRSADDGGVRKEGKGEIPKTIVDITGRRTTLTGGHRVTVRFDLDPFGTDDTTLAARSVPTVRIVKSSKEQWAAVPERDDGSLEEYVIAAHESKAAVIGSARKWMAKRLAIKLGVPDSKEGNGKIKVTTGNAEDDDKLSKYRDIIKSRVSRGLGSELAASSEQKSFELLEAREKADPKKWRAGYGVGYRVYGQINRGFRIIEIDPLNKTAFVRSVADTGLTATGGDHDKIKDRWVHIAELVRDKRFDAKGDKQATHDKKLESDRARNPNKRVPEGMGPGDVFSGKSKQTDIEDVKNGVEGNVGKPGGEPSKPGEKPSGANETSGKQVDQGGLGERVEHAAPEAVRGGPSSEPGSTGPARVPEAEPRGNKRGGVGFKSDTKRTFAKLGMTKADVLKAIMGEFGVQAARAVNSGKVKIVQKFTDLPENFLDAEAEGEFGATQGAYDPDTDTIYLVADYLSPATAGRVYLHEQVHSRLSGVLREGQGITQALLGDTAYRRAIDELNRLATHGTATERRIIDAGRKAAKQSGADTSVRDEEFLAYTVDRALHDRETSPVLVKWARRILASVRAWLYRNGITAKVSPDMLVELTKWAAGSDAGVKNSIKLRSRSVFEEIDNAVESESKRTKRNAIRSWDKLTSATRRHWLGALSVVQLQEVSKDVLISGKSFIEHMRKMDAVRSKVFDKADRIAEKWSKLSRLETNRLAYVIHESTISELDPSKDYVPETDINASAKRIKSLRAMPRTQETLKLVRQEGYRINKEKKRKAEYDRLKRFYDALGEKPQEVFKEQFAYHAEHSKDVQQGLKELIQRSGMSGNAKREAIAQMAVEFEKVRKKGPYAPLARQGDYWVRATPPTGPAEFHMFMTIREQSDFLKDIKGKGWTDVRKGKQLENIREITGVSSEFVSQVEELLKQLGDDPIVASVRDQVYQLYLKSLPEVSARKKFIHRKKTPGYGEDALRAFAEKSFHDAFHYSRLMHGSQMADVVSSMKAGVRAAESSAALKAIRDKLAKLDESEMTEDEKAFQRKNFEDQISTAEAINKTENSFEFASNAFDEFQQAYRHIMSPQVSPLAHAANQFGFLWFLGFSPSAWIVNAAQAPVISLPYVAAKFGMAKAAPAFASAYKRVFTKGPDGTYSIQNALSGEALEAYNIALANGTIDRTRGHDLAGLAEQGAERFGFNRKFMEVASAGFHHTERVNREVTFMASYELARKSGMSFQDSVDYATQVTDKTHFVYSAENRPRFLRSDLARVIGQFKMYSQGATYLQWKSFADAFFSKGVDPQIRKEARRFLAMQWGIQFAVAGAMGLPIGGAWMLASALLSGDEDDPEDFEGMFRQAMADWTGSNTAGQAASTGLVNALTPIDLHSRLSMRDLWLRDPDRDVEGHDAAFLVMSSIMGPMAGIIDNMLVGAKLINDGEFERGAEKMLPKVLHDAMQGIRFAKEGAKTLKGDDLVPDVSFFESLAKAAGFTPSRLEARYSENTAKKNVEARLLDRRRELLRDAAEARTGTDKDVSMSAGAAITSWNRAHPAMAIKPADVVASVRARARYRKESEGGVYISKRARQELGYSFAE